MHLWAWPGSLPAALEDSTPLLVPSAAHEPFAVEGEGAEGRGGREGRVVYMYIVYAWRDSMREGPVASVGGVPGMNSGMLLPPFLLLVLLHGAEREREREGGGSLLGR